MFKQSLKCSWWWQWFINPSKTIHCILSLHLSYPFRWRVQSASGPRSLSTVCCQVVLRPWCQCLCTVLVRRLWGQRKQLWDWSQLQEFLCLHVTDCVLRKGCVHGVCMEHAHTRGTEWTDDAGFTVWPERRLAAAAAVVTIGGLLQLKEMTESWLGSRHCLSGCVHTAGAPVQVWIAAQNIDYDHE